MQLNNSIFSIYGSHDSNITVVSETGEYFTYEIEKINGIRHFSLEKDPNYYDTLLIVKDIIFKDFNNTVIFETCLYGQCSEKIIRAIEEIFNCSDFKEIGHHLSHASTSFYTSDFRESLIVTYDSGGHDNGDVSTFNFFIGDRKKGIRHLEKVNLNVCDPYTCLAIPLDCISKKISQIDEIHDLSIIYQISESYLTLAGKIMGLAGYGKCREDWVEFFKEYYSGPCDDRYRMELGEKIGLDLKNIDSLNWEDSLDIAATSQQVFNQMTYTKILAYLKKYKLPVCLSGGGAMNIIFNQYLRNKIEYPVHVPPNPGDCGLSLGFMLNENKPSHKIECAFNGIDLIDRHNLSSLISEYSAKECSIDLLTELIKDGKIIGIVYGRGEVGERALLRRSIVASPSIKGIKDRLNKIKNRESWRPLAPVILEEFTDEYFTSFTSSPYMSFNPEINPEVSDKIKEIVHIDGTARAQTLNFRDNPFGYNLVKSFFDKTGIPILINTSFNNRGKSILSTISEALDILENTDIDHVWIEGYLFNNKKNI